DDKHEIKLLKHQIYEKNIIIQDLNKKLSKLDQILTNLDIFFSYQEDIDIKLDKIIEYREY
ncbi:10776_t:CDS:1, partial [Scutellospora calospora]